MKLLEAVRMALRSLTANKLRSSLTMLGIIIGVGSVIALMSIGRGVEARVTSSFQAMGTNVIYIVPRSSEIGGIAGLTSSSPTLTLADAEALTGRIPAVLGVAAQSEQYGEVTFGSESTITVINGVTPEYEWVQNATVEYGQFISSDNLARRDMVAVIGSKVVEDLFGTADPIGQKMKIRGKLFTVIGVLEAKGGMFMGISMDNLVLVPITTFQTKLFIQRTASGEDSVQSINVKVANADDIPLVTQVIKDILRARHRLAPDEKNDFSVVSQDQILGTLQQIIGLFTIFLGAIAGISLLVGGIGIMNIMLVSVTERTREIGIRKAVGAKRSDILLQFLAESAVLSFIGGGLGVLGGWLLSLAVSKIAVQEMTIETVVSLDIVALALSVSIIIGLVSGMYPAMRASRLRSY